MVEALNSPAYNESCSPLSIPGEYEETPRYIIFIQNASSKLGLDGVYRVISKDQEKDYGIIDDYDKQSLAVPESPIESFKKQEMSSRIALLARKFSIGK